METFYHGLNIATKHVVDASANGAILSKTYNEAYEILERITSNNFQWADVRSNQGNKTQRVLEVDALSSIKAQLASVTNILQNLALGQDSMFKAPVHTAAIINQTVAESCVYCGEEYTFDKCPSNSASIFYVGNQASQGNSKNNPFSNTYNPGWRNHPNFLWKGQGSSNQQMPHKANYPPGFGLQNQLAYNSQQVNTQGKGTSQAQYTSGTSIESLIQEYMAKNDVVIQSQQASLRNLEVQVGQLATELRNRPLGKLPANTETPKREGEKKSAEQGDSHSQETADTQQRNEEPAVQKEHNKDYAEIEEQPKMQTTGQESRTYTPAPPFPQRIKRKKEEVHFEKFMDILKEIHINILLVEALKQMPNYVKFLKDVQ
ncbi:uncharacterized protein LOC111794553 [Cucurbita pepo subsp. pepo]|uniref:uncharacterized protein LOC111794553 n=1 Tax=Cucurbita pepo subsp. pepo TaxID=3664 RepID=UPI000C9D38D3|nr:uncharacterized protein LOC111794553 [Cucurbita pepo subsp. pepo]